jgi:anti-anti-sigma factor
MRTLRLRSRASSISRPVPRFREHLTDADQSEDTVVVDLRDVTFLDSCGIGELVGAQQRAHRDGRRLVVVRREGTPIHQVLRVAELDEALEVTADPHEVGAPPPGAPVSQRARVAHRAPRPRHGDPARRCG